MPYSLDVRVPRLRRNVRAKTGTMQGTSLGPNLWSEVADSWEKGTYKGVAESLEDKYGEKFTEAIIQHALDAAAVGLEPEAWGRRDSLESADFLGHDEASCTIMGKSGWVAASRDTIRHHLSGSRSRATFGERVMIPGRPATVDGYAVCDTLDIMRRCWARIMGSLYGGVPDVHHPAPPSGEAPPSISLGDGRPDRRGIPGELPARP